MNKKVLMVAAVATMACASMVGCSKNTSEVIDLAPGVSVDATGEQGALTVEPEQDPMAVEKPTSVAEGVAEQFNVKLEDNQYIISAHEKEAIVLNAMDGFSFRDRYSPLEAYMVNKDFNESYLVYDCTGNLTKESLSEMKDVEDMGDGCYIQKNELIKAYCFKDGASVVIVYNNSSGKTTDMEKVTSNIKSFVKDMTVIK